jgi:RNA polymerase sigma factor (sigma-70 family)
LENKAMQQSRSEIVGWVGSQILPHEADVRRWLRRAGTSAHDADDIVQEAYCRIAGLQGVSHIANGRAYFYQTARNIVVERIRRARIVRIDCVTEIDALIVIDDEPSPERVVAGQRELRRVQRLIEDLPGRCREIFKLRRIEGLPQKEIARRLGVTENVVEMQTMRGLRLVLAALARDGAEPSAQPGAVRDERAPNRKRDR